MGIVTDLLLSLLCANDDVFGPDDCHSASRGWASLVIDEAIDAVLHAAMLRYVTTPFATPQTVWILPPSAAYAGTYRGSSAM
ncbi:MAG: hypothetical protein ACOX87_05275 [Chloroflexota bacterium]